MLWGRWMVRWAVRYPRGKAYCCEKEEREPIVYAKAELLYEGKDVLILAVGNMVSKACEVRKKLAVQGIHPTIVNMRFVKPFDEDLVRELAISHRLIVTMEDNVYTGGFSEQIQAFLLRERITTNVLVDVSRISLLSTERRKNSMRNMDWMRHRYRIGL